MKCPVVSPDQTSPYEVFQPFVPQGDDLTSDDADFAFLVVARLKQGATIRQASAELSGMLSAYSATNHLPIQLSAIVAPLSQEVTANIRQALWLLLAAVLGLLLIACVNLASLQLARAMVRERDNANSRRTRSRADSPVSSDWRCGCFSRRFLAFCSLPA